MHGCCSWSVRRWSKSCTECGIEMILKRGLSLVPGRVAARREQHRFKLNRCECDFTDLKKMWSFITGAFSASLILVYPILLLIFYVLKYFSCPFKIYSIWLLVWRQKDRPPSLESPACSFWDHRSGGRRGRTSRCMFRGGRRQGWLTNSLWPCTEVGRCWSPCHPEQSEDWGQLWTGE